MIIDTGGSWGEGFWTQEVAMLSCKGILFKFLHRYTAKYASKSN